MNFKDILTVVMEDYGIGIRKLEEILVDQGITDINFRRISEYKSGKFTPSYEKAKILLNALDYSISEEELLESLKENRESIKFEEEYIMTEQKEIRRTIRIKLKNIMPDEEPEVAERYLKERIASIFGDEKNLSNYIQSLIAKDLQQYIIDKEDILDV